MIWSQGILMTMEWISISQRKKKILGFWKISTGDVVEAVWGVVWNGRITTDSCAVNSAVGETHDHNR